MEEPSLISVRTILLILMMPAEEKDPNFILVQLKHFLKIEKKIPRGLLKDLQRRLKREPNRPAKEEPQLETFFRLTETHLLDHGRLKASWN